MTEVYDGFELYCTICKQVVGFVERSAMNTRNIGTTVYRNMSVIVTPARYVFAINTAVRKTQNAIIPTVTWKQ